MKINKNVVFALIGTLITALVCKNIFQEFTVVHAIISFFLWLPYRIGENHYSVFGGFSENSIYSVFGIYQKAGNDAVQFIGISLYQHAGNDAYQVFGISFYQKALEFKGNASLYVIRKKIQIIA